MTITEFAILAFKLPPDFSDPALQLLFQRLSAWQSDCSGYPLLFFTNPEDPLQVHLMTGWQSVAAHVAWIKGERNQALLSAFAPYVDLPRVRMVHVDVDFEAVPSDAAHAVAVARYDGGADAAIFNVSRESADGSAWSLFGRDLAEEGGDIYRFGGSAGDLGYGVGQSPGATRRRILIPVEQWVLKRVGFGIEP